MKILVDADACPVKEIIVRAAKKYEKEVLMVCDVAHQLFYEEPFVTVKTVDKGADVPIWCWQIWRRNKICASPPTMVLPLCFSQKVRQCSIPTVFSTATTPLTVCSLNVIFPGKCAARKKAGAVTSKNAHRSRTQHFKSLWKAFFPSTKNELQTTPKNTIP